MLPQPSVVTPMPRDKCSGCYLEPCACTHITNLEPGGRLHGLFEVAKAEFDKPMPHRGGCPCPRCYSQHSATWRCPACSQDNRGRRPCDTHRRTT